MSIANSCSPLSRLNNILNSLSLIVGNKVVRILVHWSVLIILGLFFLFLILKKIKHLESIIREWEPDNLDYDFKECSKHCYTDTDTNCYRWDATYLLCNSCAKLLDEKLRIPFNKTPREIGQEFQALNDRIEKLEKLVQTILEKINKEENI